MRVGLDITQAVKRKARGIARYISDILPHLLSRSLGPESDFEPILYVRGDRIFRRRSLASLQGGARTRWMPLRLYLAGRGLDLFHSFGNYLPLSSRVPVTFTAHDFRVLDLGEPGEGARLNRNVARSDGIVCLTGHGRSRLLHHFPDYDPRRLAVIPHGVDHARFHPMDEDEAGRTALRHGLQAPYLLQLGSWFRHKNLELAIEAFARSRAAREGSRLAFVGGGAEEAYRKSLLGIAQSRGVADQIDWLEDIPGEDIPAVVAAASCLLQPSRYEGFGLPLLEAMAVGTPGVVSDSSCLPEVSGGAWPVAGQDNVDAFAAAIDDMVFDAEKRAFAVAAGLERAAGFTWEETARRTIAFFRHIAEL